MGLGLFVWDARASPERSAGRFLVRQGVDAAPPRDAANQLPATWEKRGADRTGVEILAYPRLLLLPNTKRATRNIADAIRR